MKRIMLLAGVVFSLSLSTMAQNSSKLAGRLTQAGSPEPDAIISLVSKSDASVRFETKTDTDGRFYFEGVLPGSYTVFAKPDDPRVRSITLSARADVRLTPGEERFVELDFAASILLRESVTVSADSTQPIDEVSKTVNLIDAQELRDRADFALAETLRTIPGFRVQQLGGFGRTATVKTRGLRNQDTAILLDGVRLRDASAITGDASPFIGDLTLTSVSRIEVLRGSGSSLYGTNAIGGTVDFQTPKPQAGFHGQASYAAGGLGLQRFRGNVSDGTRDGKFGFNLAAARTVYTGGIDGEDDAANTNFQSRIEYNPFSRTNISGRFFVSDAFVRLNSSPDTVLGALPDSNATIIRAIPNVTFDPDANDPISNQKSKFFNGQFVASHAFDDKVVLRGLYSGLKTSRKNNNSGFSTSLFDGTIQTANATVNWAPNSMHDIKIGYEFEHEKYGNDGLTPTGTGNFFTRAFQSSNTFFAQDLVSLFEGRLQIAGGFRMQAFSLDDPRFSTLNAPYANLSLENPPTAYTFDGAASYFVRETGTKIRAHVGNGYRVPSLFERYGTFFSTFGGAAFFALGDPNLKPEKTIAFDGGVEQYLASDKVKLTAVYFYTKLIDTIGFGNEVPDIGNTERQFGGYENQKGGIARGGEFSGSVKPTRSTDIFASYTFTNSDQRTPQVSGSGILRTLGIPNHQFTLVATQRFKRFWVNFDLLASSSHLAPIFDTNNLTFETYIYRFKGNRRGDLTAGYTIPLNKDRFSLRVFGTVENLFDYEYFENGFKTVGRNARVGLSFGF